MASTTSALSYKDIMDAKKRLDTSQILPAYSPRDLDYRKMQELLKVYQLTGQPFPAGIWDNHEPYDGAPQPPDMPPNWKSSYDPYSKKEIIMKPLFQFTTVKPPAVTIWETLSNHEIESVGGYTVDQIRFYMYVVLQLRTDFKSAKELCNNYSSKVAELHIAMKDLLGLNTNTSAAIKLPPVGFTNWVVSELYIPYYMFKQLNMRSSDPLWLTLFDRTDSNQISTAELDHIIADNSVIAKYITSYKLWLIGNDIISDKYSDIFAIQDDFTPELVSASVDILFSLSEYMYDHLEDSDNHIFDYSRKIVIKPFKIGVSDAPQ